MPAPRRSLAVGSIAAGLLATASPAAALPAGGCTHETEITTWSGGFTASLTVTNTGTEALTDWRIEFEMPAHAHITSGWNSRFHTLHSPVVVLPGSWNAHLPVGDLVNPQFTGIQSGTVTIWHVRLDGVDCAPATP